MAFHVGQKVVCVDDRLIPLGPSKSPEVKYHPQLDGLTKGTVYTVCWFGEFEDKYWARQKVVRLQEIVRVDDYPFSAARFLAPKPVKSRKTESA